MEQLLYTVIVHSENLAGVLNQVTAAFTRRQINIESLNVSASSIQGIHKYTITAFTDEDNINKVTQQISKKIDVVQAHYFVDNEVMHREIALYKLATPVMLHNPEISEVIRKFSAHLIEVNDTFAVVEMSGVDDDVTALYEALKHLDCVLQFVRSGRVAITTSCFERVNQYLKERREKHQLLFYE